MAFNFPKIVQGARQAYRAAAPVIKTGARIVGESAVEAFREVRDEQRYKMDSAKMLEDYAKMAETGQQRLNERLEQLALEMRQPTPADRNAIRVYALGSSLVVETGNPDTDDEIYGYVIDPINKKVKRYTCARNAPAASSGGTS